MNCSLLSDTLHCAQLALNSSSLARDKGLHIVVWSEVGHGTTSEGKNIVSLSRVIRMQMGNRGIAKRTDDGRGFGLWPVPIKLRGSHRWLPASQPQVS